MSRFVLLFSAALLFSACADSIVSECDLAVPEAMPARFSAIESQVFATGCALAGCHAGSNPQAGLDLTPGNAYASLVGVASINYPAQQRVKPGSSGESVLIGVLRGSLVPSMPPAGALDAAVIDSIAAWIDGGALND
ncbi:MAG: hypothetical protein RRA94_00350 [Bacteroidota bacterium]|nr:hypothetical protein [Bacteroidota bacterium]